MSVHGFDQLKRHEGKRNALYHDSRGVETIGYGHNLRDRPLSDDAVNAIFDDDIADVMAEVDEQLPWSAALNEPRQWVLYNMAFNLGVAGLLTFRNALAFIEAGQFTEAAMAMLDSLWAVQVGSRATELARQMETGEWVDA